MIKRIGIIISDWVPIPWKRPGRSAHGKTRIDLQVREKDDLLKRIMAKRPLEPMTGSIYIQVRFYLPIPKSWPKKKVRAALKGAIMPTIRGTGDIDNYVKFLLDALQRGGWMKEDVQVFGIDAEKVYGHPAGLEMTIVEFGEDDDGQA